MIKSTQEYFGNLFTKLIWMEINVKNKHKIHLDDHLDELSRWTKQTITKIWMDHLE